MTHPRAMQIEQFLAGCRQIIASFYAKQYPNLPLPALSVKYGPRYAKVVIDHGSGPSVWAFIDLDSGDILKPANWQAPAKHARGNLDDAKFGLGRITAFGPEYLR